MATVSFTRTMTAGATQLHVWTPLTAANADGDPMTVPGAADRSVQVTGTFDGGTLTLQGSNEATPTNWASLTNEAGDVLAFTAAGLGAVSPNTLWIRPLLSGAGGSASVTVNLLSKV